MKIKSKTLHVCFTHDVTLGHNGSIEATLEHFAFISEGKNGEIDIDMDFTDVHNVKFMGMPIEKGWEGYKKFKASMLQLGINVDELMDDKAAEIITDEEFEQLKALYKSTVNKCYCQCH